MTGTQLITVLAVLNSPPLGSAGNNTPAKLICPAHSTSCLRACIYHELMCVLNMYMLIRYQFGTGSNIFVIRI
jgi:hypothetical protein